MFKKATFWNREELRDFFVGILPIRNLDCCMLSSNTNKQTTNRHKFTAEEDSLILELVHHHGARRWDFIAQSLPGRTGRQCRDRYRNYLMTDLHNGPWSKEEDEQLIQKVEEFGSHWSKIAKFFKGRSPNNLKNRWYTYGRKNGVESVKNDFSMEQLINPPKKITAVPSILSVHRENDGIANQPKLIRTKLYCGNPAIGPLVCKSKSISPDLKTMRVIQPSHVFYDNTFFQEMSMITPKCEIDSYNHEL